MTDTETKDLRKQSETEVAESLVEGMISNEKGQLKQSLLLAKDILGITDE